MTFLRYANVNRPLLYMNRSVFTLTQTSARPRLTRAHASLWLRVGGGWGGGGLEALGSGVPAHGRVLRV